MEIKNYSIEELEELAIDEDLDAIKELVRRYREGDGVEPNATIANHWSSQLGEDPESADTMSEEGIDEEPDEKTSWDEQYHVMKRRIIGQLREEAVKGNPTALIVLAEKYFNSANSSEINEGFRLLDEAEGILRADLSGENAALSKEALVYLFNLKGEKLEEEYQRTENNALPERIFKAYSNAYELDPTQVEGIARCYEMGMGVGRDENKARAYIEQKALQGGIEEKYKIGKKAFDASETMRATEWLQNALLSEDAEEHRTLKHCIRLLLGKLNATDEEGNAIDEEQELNTLLQLVESQNDPEAALCIASFTDRDEEKLRYYELGAVGSPDKYASVCARNAERIKNQMKEVERKLQEEAIKRANEERQREEERRRQEEEAKRRAEQQAFEEQQREEEKAKKRNRMRIIAIALVALSIIVGIVAGTSIHKQNVAAEKERQKASIAQQKAQQKIDEVRDKVGVVLGTWYECDPNTNEEVRSIELEVDKGATCVYKMGEQEGTFICSEGEIVLDDGMKLTKSQDEYGNIVLENNDAKTMYYSDKQIAEANRFAQQYKEQLVGEWVCTSGGQTLIFKDDGTFRYKDKPDSYFTYDIRVTKDHVKVVFHDDELEQVDEHSPQEYDNVINEMKHGEYTILPVAGWLLPYSKKM